MLLILSTGLVCLGLLGWRKYLRYCQGVEKNKIAYLNVLRTLRALFEHLPQHRGMANAYLQGDESFKSKLEQTAQTIHNDIVAVEAALSFNRNDLVSERWAKIKKDWGQLASGVMTMSPVHSFAKHTALIQQVLYLMGDCAAYLDACEKTNSDTYRLSNMLFNDMPQMMEFVGRARGVGTGVAGSGVLTVANRVKLSFLHECAQERLRICDVVSAQVLDGPGYSELRAKAAESHKAASDFIDLLKFELLDVDKINIKPAVYYDAGTQAIGTSLRLMDDLMPLLEQAFIKSAQRGSKYGVFLGLTSVLSFVGFATVWVFV